MQRHNIWHGNVPLYDLSPYKKRTCLLQTDGVITVFKFCRPKSHIVQYKLEDPFSARRLASNPLTTCVDINDLRMRINLQHRGSFPLAAVGVKRFIY